MRTLLTTTALVTLFTVSAFAQEAAPMVAPSDLLTQGYNLVDTDGLASKLIGFPVYTSSANDAEQLGEVNDLVIGESGGVSAVILGVGGFLGAGEKNVAVAYDELDWVTAEDNTERLVLATTREALEAAPNVELIDDQAADVAVAPANDATAPAAADDIQTGTIAPAADAMTPFDPATASDFDETALTAEELIGTNVYGPDNQHIGAIGDLVLGADGAIDALIIDFGGFLGIGVKEVAVGFDDLSFYSDNTGNARSLVLNVTREQMDQAVAFDRETWEAQRDTQRLTVSAL